MEKAEYRLLFDLEDTYWWHRGLCSIAEQLIKIKQTLPMRSSRVLDAGCGTGGWLKRLDKHFWATGLDISRDALYFCRQRNIEKLALGDVSNLPYKDNSFDLVTAFDVLEHRKVSSDLTALEEFFRVLKPNGRLLFNVPAYEFMRSYRDRVVHSGNRYTALKVKRMLRKTKFRILRLTYWNTFLFPFALSMLLMNKDSYKAGVSLPRFPKVINSLMFKILTFEAAILRLVNLPYGLSICCLVKKD